MPSTHLLAEVGPLAGGYHASCCLVRRELQAQQLRLQARDCRRFFCRSGFARLGRNHHLQKEAPSSVSLVATRSSTCKPMLHAASDAHPAAAASPRPRLQNGGGVRGQGGGLHSGKNVGTKMIMTMIIADMWLNLGWERRFAVSPPKGGFGGKRAG